MVINFEIPGTPQGKARARTFFDKKRDKMQSITPDKTVRYENLVKICFLQKRPVPFSIFTGPVEVTITAYYRKAKTNKMTMPMLKPDADNICKVVLDSLNGVAYLDDKQVIHTTISKQWSEGNEEKTTVIIQSL